MSDVVITSTPLDAVQHVDPDVTAALDLLGITLTRTTRHWIVDVRIDNGTRLTASPALDTEPAQETAA